ncbi:MAG: CocE/NonD family hydrolase [Ilumatobacteraceae bacterium]|nr:CocE/NonD family hydrolase [Ilumatobacteraceae bacterium]MBP8208889.1 CocE/NonD family hydrolase [Ilumatobacteraceae bacterium]HQY84338.1 CocE/NonD family hydrolase [Ilumatobacteraceae bacterium]HRA83882.1 CocE/NonD family hydrolase [Ilumatobacteraceae bacterium]
MQVSEQLVSIAVEGGAVLAGTLYLPDAEGPFATLLEALPYRMSDVGASYADGYLRFAGEGGFAVLRIDVRGTGNSTGVAEDEYPDIERRDLRTVIEWVAAQPWSTGKVGMLGTSYSGFNSLHMAMEGIPQLGAIAAMYATDDRYTDDVHYMGGVLRAIDLIDYPLYMIAMNALPPTPAVWAGAGFGGDWEAEWQRRIDQHEPWLLEWLRHPRPDATWRRGSVRLGPRGDGYQRMSCPVLLISGWADGYRNNTFRAIEHLPDWHLIAGPWAHKDPSVARPGPNIDSDLELMRFFDQHLRGGPQAGARRGQIFVRRPTPAEPDLALHDGHWVEVDVWPPTHLREIEYVALDALANTGRPIITELDEQLVDDVVDLVDVLAVRGDVGVTAWNSCAGGLPWGQPLDQRSDNAHSITYDWVHAVESMMMGNGEVALRVRSSASVGHVSVKLCDIAPDGSSTLITRGMLDLAQRGMWPTDPFGELAASAQPIVPGEWIDVTVQFEATTWTLLPGHRLRLAIAGTDWPNCWPAAQPFTLGVQRASVRLSLPTAAALPRAHNQFQPGPGPSADDAEGVEWRYETDVLARESRVHTRYGGTYSGTHGTTVTDVYEGSLGISTVDLSQAWATGRSRYDMTFNLPGSGHAVATCSTEATLQVRSDRDWFHVDIALRAERDGALFAERTWSERFPR